MTQPPLSQPRQCGSLSAFRFWSKARGWGNRALARWVAPGVRRFSPPCAHVPPDPGHVLAKQQLQLLAPRADGFSVGGDLCSPCQAAANRGVRNGRLITSQFLQFVGLTCTVRFFYSWLELLCNTGSGAKKVPEGLWARVRRLRPVTGCVTRSCRAGGRWARRVVTVGRTIKSIPSKNKRSETERSASVLKQLVC